MDQNEFDSLMASLPPDVAQEIANRAVDAGFLEEGFLSPMSALLVDHLVPNNAGWFDICNRLNRLAQMIVNRAVIEGPKDDPKPISARLLLKSNQSFQGAVLLAQRGMTAEAETLARTCLEITLWLGYLKTSPNDAAALFVADEHKSVAERANMVAKLMDENSAKRFFEVSRMAYAEYAKGPQKIQVKELADRAGLSDLYAYYRTLCAVSAHPSISSIDKFIELGPDGQLNFRTGPDDDGIPFALMTAVNAVIWGLEFFVDFHEIDGVSPYLTAIQQDRDGLLALMA